MSCKNLSENAQRLNRKVGGVLCCLGVISFLVISGLLVRAESIRSEQVVLLAASQVGVAIARDRELSQAVQQGNLEAADLIIQPVVNAVADQHPNVRLGVYSRPTASIVSVYPPNEQLRGSHPKDNNCFACYASGQPEYCANQGKFTWAHLARSVTVPIYLENRAIGHAWAGTQPSPLLIALWLPLAIVLACLLPVRYLLRRQIDGCCAGVGRDLSQFAAALSRADHDLSEEMVTAELQPLLQLVRQHQAALAQEVEEKEEAKNELSQFLAICPDLVLVIRRERIIRANPSACAALGRSQEELIGLHYEEFVHADDLPEISQLLATDGKTQPHSLRLLPLTGPCRTISALAFSDDAGTVLAIGRDLTEQNELQTSLAKLEKLNLAGEMAASISHEIRNPLTTVRGFIQLARIRQDQTVLDEHYQTIMDELDRANSIITEFLSLSRDKGYQRNRSNLNRLLALLHPLIAAEAVMSGHQLVLEQNDIPPLFLDESEIRQLVLNLVKNGLQAMKHPGTLTIRTRLQPEGVELEVADQGPGIPEEILRRIGTPFFTTKDEGSGLGLAVCYRIAEHHDAVIRVTTNGSGTSFTVLFPLG